jgi:hypothetical protein
MFMDCRAKAGAANNAATTVRSANFFTVFSFKDCVQTRISTSRETLRKYQIRRTAGGETVGRL